MNPKQEFIKSIMSVLRLEQNIYTMGAIETIIERLKVSDYALFIAYLGERKSDYEKPIESIAKGVDEFYSMKLEPHKDEARKNQDHILLMLIDFKKYISDHLSKNIDFNDIDNEVFENYKKQDQETQQYQIAIKREEFLSKKVNEKVEELSEHKERLIIGLKSITVSKTKERALTDKQINIILEIGFNKIMTSDNYWENDLIFNHIFTHNIKPSVTQQIAVSEYSKIYNDEITSSKTKLLLSRKTPLLKELIVY